MERGVNSGEEKGRKQLLIILQDLGPEQTNSWYVAVFIPLAEH